MDTLFDDMVAHQIYLERIKAGEAKVVREKLKALDGEIIAVLGRLSENYTQLELTTALYRINALTYKFYSNKLLPHLTLVGLRTIDFEVKFITGIIRKYLSKEGLSNKPNRKSIIAKAAASKLDGKTLPNWTVDLATDKVNRAAKAARNAAAESATAAEIVTAVKPQLKVANTNAETITKSYVNQYANVSREEAYQVNQDKVRIIVWSSILDHRTTETCGARSNKMYDAITKEPIGHNNLWEGGPGIIHWGCRSTGIPTGEDGIVVAGPSAGHKWDDGERVAIGGEEDYTRGDNRNKDGSLAKIPTRNNWLDKQVVPAKLDYETWLRRQPREFVEDVLGVGKASLFLDKKMSIQKFVVPDGRELTLQQLDAA